MQGMYEILTTESEELAVLNETFAILSKYEFEKNSFLEKGK
jgi:hypothetical protein